MPLGWEKSGGPLKAVVFGRCSGNRQTGHAHCSRMCLVSRLLSDRAAVYACPIPTLHTVCMSTNPPPRPSSHRSASRTSHPARRHPHNTPAPTTSLASCRHLVPAGPTTRTRSTSALSLWTHWQWLQTKTYGFVSEKAAGTTSDTTLPYEAGLDIGEA